MSPRARRSLGLLSLAVLTMFPVAFALGRSVPGVEAFLVLAGAPDGQHRERARLNGLMLSFLSEIPTTFVTAPPEYSQATVATTLDKYARSGRPAPRAAERPVNLIVYVIESFMDPQDLGLRYTADPIPNVRALQRSHRGGYAIVPEAFGGSANTEFELLTGMTRSFLPDGSLPYRQYVRRPIPSLPRTLRAAGYSTVAIQADAKYYYDRERVYDLLGFETTVWLADVPGVARVRGGWPSDAAAVDAVMRIGRGRQPFFAFVFPSSTHSPYHYGTYVDSDLDVLDVPAGEGKGEIKEYANAVREADRAVGALIDHFRRWPDPTLIVVLGDHLPPLSDKALIHTSLSTLSETDRARILHRVPLLVWANFELPREARDISTNALAPFLLDTMGIPYPGFLAVVGEVRRKLPVLGSYAQSADGQRWDRDALPADLRAIVEDYRVLQYDVLLGEQYALGSPSRGRK
jgi:phosphoglycerol transferase MdoB-like AlkP superfamily enzyme